MTWQEMAEQERLEEKAKHDAEVRRLRGSIQFLMEAREYWHNGDPQFWFGLMIGAIAGGTIVLLICLLS
jgi:hypothetical protein